MTLVTRCRGTRPRPLLRLMRILLPVSGVVVAALAMRHVAAGLDQASIRRAVLGLPAPRVALTLLLTAVSYAVLAMLDVVALRYAGVRLGKRRTVLASFAAYALSHTIGFAVMTGAAVRYRLYSAWGVAPAGIARAVAFTALTFWLGVLAALGTTLAVSGAAVAASVQLSAALATALAVLCATVLLAYLWLAVRHTGTLRFRRYSLVVPSTGTAIGQILLSLLDWIVAGLVLAVALPAGSVPIGIVLAAFVLGQLAGTVSHVPAGLGVFEATVLAILHPWLPAPAILAALLAYRAVYYAIPFTLAVGLLAIRELTAAGASVRVVRNAGLRAARAIRATTDVCLAAIRAHAEALTPPALAAAVFAGGVVLLYSGATPAVSDRMRLLHDVSPTPIIEGAYFLASLTGVALLLVARGLWRRLDGAYALSLLLLAAGTVLSVLKGLDYEEAIFLACVLAALAPARRYFHRRAALFTVDFSPRWLLAVMTVLISSLWLFFFSHQRVLFSGDVPWHFMVAGGSSQALRATVGAAVFAALAGLARLLRPVQPTPPIPGPDELSRAATIVAGSPVTSAALALLGDKALLFNDAGTAFLMYGVSGQTWVAMGDPVGPERERAALAREFRELADRHGGQAVFYQVSQAGLPLYLDLGLTPFKLGESARVSLETFSLDGGSRKWLRRARKLAIDAGCSFEVVAAGRVRDLLPVLRDVSDSWLATRRAREKGFSLGFYDDGYLGRQPIAVVHRDGAIVAFANLWLGDGREELSVDLVRYSTGAPPGLTDYLFSELMLWGRAAGYRWFDLGMAPLSGLEQRRFAPLWNRVGGIVYQRGNTWYNFKGLRQFKEKFDPIWEPRYLAAPGGAAAAAAVTRVTALVSRGLTGAVSR